MFKLSLPLVHLFVRERRLIPPTGEAMKNGFTGKQAWGGWKIAFIAATVVCGLSGCGEDELGREGAFDTDGDEEEGDRAVLGSPPADNAFPVAGYVLTESCSNGFGDPRPGGRTHQGVDCFAVEDHAPLVAVEDATIRVVKTAAESASYSGNSISIRGDSGWRYYYGHIHSTQFRKADEGVTRVKKGEVIALMGSTGTGVEHLHFEAAPGNSDAVNPWPFMGTWQRNASVTPAAPAPPPTPPASCDGRSCTAVYRTYKSGQHFYTSSANEATGAGFTIEFGGPYYWVDAVNHNGFVPWYRCLKGNGKHFYTTSSTCEGQKVEGAMGWVATGAVAGAHPLYRLYSPSLGNHFYTTSASERDTVAQSFGYTYEGVACYVW